MTWNYRVARKALENGEAEYSIVEAYYDDNGVVDGYSDFLEVTGESPNELREDLVLMLKAFERPILGIV